MVYSGEAACTAKVCWIVIWDDEYILSCGGLLPEVEYRINPLLLDSLLQLMNRCKEK